MLAPDVGREGWFHYEDSLHIGNPHCTATPLRKYLHRQDIFENYEVVLRGKDGSILNLSLIELARLVNYKGEL